MVPLLSMVLHSLIVSLNTIALGIPGFAIQDFDGSAFGRTLVVWSSLMYSFECAAECVAVLLDDPILGMMQFMNL
jgi:hypothetical protein